MNEVARKIESVRESNSSVLDLSGMGLTELPESIGRLTALQQLDVSSNQLTALPEAIGKLTALQQLNVSHNQLTALPDSIGKLTELPDAPNLKFFYHHGNRF
jgi:Leucine-rich repeat (LRR) protein